MWRKFLGKFDVVEGDGKEVRAYRYVSGVGFVGVRAGRGRMYLYYEDRKYVGLVRGRVFICGRATFKACGSGVEVHVYE